jgi:hypothetical protein
MTFKRAHHQKIALILEQLNAEKLVDAACYFGGGTAIALRFDEFRESVDIDLMVSNIEGYRQLRSDVTAPGGLANLFKSNLQLDLSAEVRADQYGIRSFIKVLGKNIKFEIVLEGRINFDKPNATDSLLGISCLSTVDLLASKLLANSDRGGDASVFSRDLIDMAMMQFSNREWAQAYQKATTAYGPTIKKDLIKVCDSFIQNKVRLRQCMHFLKIEITETELVQKVRHLRLICKKAP